MSSAEISQTALRLPPQERAALIDQLFDSIDTELTKERRAEIEARWSTESEARIDAVEREELKIVDGPATMEKLRRSITK